MITLEEFKKIELRIAEIISAAPHPEADKLLVLRIRIGEEERTLVAGIRNFYEPSNLVGKRIVVVTNLAPATIRGVTSEGMLLAASNEETLTILVPDREIASGAKIS